MMAIIVDFLRPKRKKADVLEHPQVFQHVGLLINGPPRHGRAALYLVIRRSPHIEFSKQNGEIQDAPAPGAARGFLQDIIQ
jgi:hypothetical protein